MSKRLTPYQRIRELIGDGYHPHTIILGMADVYDHEATRLEGGLNAGNERQVVAMLRRQIKAIRAAEAHLRAAVQAEKDFDRFASGVKHR